MDKKTGREKTWHTARNICRYARTTAEAYSEQVYQFIEYCSAPKLMSMETNEERVCSWLSSCVPLPESLVAPLAQHLQKVRALWEGDQLRGLPPVALPDGMVRKFPKAGSNWEWFWAFPQARVSVDPESGVVRRHHTHQKVYSRALSVAAR